MQKVSMQGACDPAPPLGSLTFGVIGEGPEDDEGESRSSEGDWDGQSDNISRDS